MRGNIDSPGNRPHGIALVITRLMMTVRAKWPPVTTTSPAKPHLIQVGSHHLQTADCLLVFCKLGSDISELGREPGQLHILNIELVLRRNHFSFETEEISRIKSRTTASRDKFCKIVATSSELLFKYLH